MRGSILYNVRLYVANYNFCVVYHDLILHGLAFSHLKKTWGIEYFFMSSKYGDEITIMDTLYTPKFLAQ